MLRSSRITERLKDPLYQPTRVDLEQARNVIKSMEIMLANEARIVEAQTNLANPGSKYISLDAKKHLRAQVERMRLTALNVELPLDVDYRSLHPVGELRTLFHEHEGHTEDRSASCSACYNEGLRD